MGLISSRSSEPASRPTAFEIPPQVPLAEGSGACGGCGGSHRRPGCPCVRSPQRRGRCARLVLAQRLQRRRSHDSRSGGSAAGVTPSAANGASDEPGRADLGLRPGFGRGGWPGMTRWPARGGQSLSTTVTSSSGLVHVLVKEGGLRSPDTGGPLILSSITPRHPGRRYRTTQLLARFPRSPLD